MNGTEMKELKINRPSRGEPYRGEHYAAAGRAAAAIDVRAAPRGGLSDEEVAASRVKYGANVMSKQKKKGFMARFFLNMWDPVIRILIAALAVNIIFTIRGGDWVECVGIAVSVFLATFISTLSEYGSEAAFEKLNSEAGQEYCRVRRPRIL